MAEEVMHETMRASARGWTVEARLSPAQPGHGQLKTVFRRGPFGMGVDLAVPWPAGAEAADVQAEAFRAYASLFADLANFCAGVAESRSRRG